METLIIALCIIAAAAVAAVLIKKARKKHPRSVEERKDPLLDIHDTRNKLTRIQPGDVLIIENETLSVRGSVNFNEDGFTWEEHFLDNGEEAKKWLSVETDPESAEEIKVAFWWPHKTEITPGDKTLTVNSITYRREEKGEARYRAKGTTGLPLDGSVKYVDYKSDTGELLGFESFNGAKWEASTGKTLNADLIEVYHRKNEE